MNLTDPLISIIVITHNSAVFVIEALESAKKQTYPNVELIISDDFSSDNTINICEDWLLANKERFQKTGIVTSSENTGTAANLNRGTRASSGEWIKFLAGDDFLYPDCIEEFLKKTKSNPEIDILFSKITRNGKEFVREKYYYLFSLNVKEQFKQLLKDNILPAPATFIKRKVIDRIHGFDEQFILLDDFPFFLKALKSGIRFFLVDKALVNYRVHETNVSAQEISFNLKYIQCLQLFYKKIYLKELRNAGLYFYYMHYLLHYILFFLVLNKFIKKPKHYNNIINWFSLLNWKYRFEKRVLLKSA